MPEGGIPRFKVPTTPVEITDRSQIFSEYFGDEEEQLYIFNDLRHRHASVLEMDGEEFVWMKRKLDGTKCPYWSDESGSCSDPLNDDAKCYNTKYLDGYHAPLRIKIGVPTSSKQVVAQEEGLLKTQPMRAWTLWEPKLADRDLLIRVMNGQRFEINEVEEAGTWRGSILTQFFDLRELQDGEHPAWEVPVPSTGL